MFMFKSVYFQIIFQQFLQVQKQLSFSSTPSDSRHLIRYTHTKKNLNAIHNGKMTDFLQNAYTFSHVLQSMASQTFEQMVTLNRNCVRMQNSSVFSLLLHENPPSSSFHAVIVNMHRYFKADYIYFVLVRVNERFSVLDGRFKILWNVLTAFVCSSLHRMFHLQAIEYYYRITTINSNCLNPWMYLYGCTRFRLHWAAAIVRMLIHGTRLLANSLFCYRIKRCGKDYNNDKNEHFLMKEWINFEIFWKMDIFLPVTHGNHRFINEISLKCWKCL